MKNFLKIIAKKFSAIALCLGLLQTSAYASNEIPIRGVVEGFYGTPWTFKERMDMLAFMSDFKMNAYIYAPKDDPYHRNLWREPYPYFEKHQLQKLINFAKEKEIKFIFAVSPGIDLKYSGADGESDRVVMTKKLDEMYNLGVRDFAIFFDDIKIKNAKGQAEFLNYLTENFVKTHEGVSPLITVPTEYFSKDMIKDGVVKEYTKTFSRAIDKDILVLYTGRGVVCDSITDEEYKAASKFYGRNLGVWWNYPVTDYLEAKLALGPIENLPKEAKIPAIFFNPMKHAKSSEITLGTGGIYAKNPKGYKADKAYRKVMEYRYENLAQEMLLVAQHSTHMENSWANAGREDSREFNKKVAALFEKLKENKKGDYEFKEIEKELVALEKASDKLLKELPRKDLREMGEQLKEMQNLTALSKNALNLLKIYQNEGETEEFLNKLIGEYEEAILRSETVKIADGSLLKFVKDTIEFVDSKQ